MFDGRGLTSVRWPDFVVEIGGARTAGELAAHLPSAARVRRIVEAYQLSGYVEVRFFAMTPLAARKLVRAGARPLGHERRVPRHVTRITVGPWPGLAGPALDAVVCASRPTAH